jgi:hypothetical protein
MKKYSYNLYLIIITCILISCSDSQKQKNIEVRRKPLVLEKYLIEDTLSDSRCTFEEAVAGSNAPQHIIDQLKLIEVTYLSVDGKIHKGQILTNQEIANDLVYLFDFMLAQQFVIEKVIPIVKYNWDDSLSMADNNTYSFCYRNPSYSKHAIGMAIDINPRFNPLRWKYKNLPNEPKNGIRDTTLNGTFYPGHPVVKEFANRGFRWGHTFSKYYDDHHFEKSK